MLTTSTHTPSSRRHERQALVRQLSVTVTTSFAELMRLAISGLSEVLMMTLPNLCRWHAGSRTLSVTAQQTQVQVHRRCVTDPTAPVQLG
jgi:hypothetical protein